MAAWLDVPDPNLARWRLTIALSVFSFLVLVPTLVLGQYFRNMARRIHRSGRYPPPDARVIQNTVVERGRAAERVAGRHNLVAALLSVIAAAGVVLLIWVLVLLWSPG